jgi:hypothetical protein
MGTNSVPSKELILQQIEAIEGVKDRVPPTSTFGDDNVKAIEAQLAVLGQNLPEQFIRNEFGWDDYVYYSAMDARHWLDGKLREGPAADWLLLGGMQNVVQVPGS